MKNLINIVASREGYKTILIVKDMYVFLTMIGKSKCVLDLFLNA